MNFIAFKILNFIKVLCYIQFHLEKNSDPPKKELA